MARFIYLLFHIIDIWKSPNR